MVIATTPTITAEKSSPGLIICFLKLTLAQKKLLPFNF